MMENKFKGQALNMIVVVEEVFQENRTASGFDITGIVDANEKQKRGRVVSVGEGCPRKPVNFFSKFKFLNFFFKKLECTLKENDEVIFDKYKTTPFTQDGNPYILVYYPDIVLVF